MENAAYDEHKGVYRVNNVDGTFETYTPAQYREQFGNPSIEREEESDITLDIVHTGEVVTLTQKDIDAHPILAESGLQVGDVGTVELDNVNFSTDVLSKEPVATITEPVNTKGKIMGAIKNVLNK